MLGSDPTATEGERTAGAVWQSAGGPDANNSPPTITPEKAIAEVAEGRGVLRFGEGEDELVLDRDDLDDDAWKARWLESLTHRVAVLGKGATWEHDGEQKGVELDGTRLESMTPERCKGTEETLLRKLGVSSDVVNGLRIQFDVLTGEAVVLVRFNLEVDSSD